LIFRRRKKKAKPDEEEQEKELEQVLFQGALSGAEVNLGANARLVEAGLVSAKALVTDALARRAHMIRIEPKGQAAAVIMVVDGVPYPGGRLSKQQALAVTQMLKLLAGLDVKQRKKPQSGGIKAEYQETSFELQVKSTPVKTGAERLVVRVRNPNEKLERAEDLGFTEELKAKIREIGSQRQGVLLVCGPPYSGTTTTTYVVLRTIDAYIYSIFSIAHTRDRDVFGVTEFEVKPDDDLSATVQRIIRSEADVIFLDPLRDAETVKVIFSEQDKVTFLSEFTAKDAAQGVLQLIAWLGDPKRVAEGLRAIISQKLIRPLCDRCKEAYRPNPKLIAKVGLPPETKTLYRPPKPKPPTPDQPPEEVEPCQKCGGIGYFGRIALIEVLEMTDAMRQLVASGPKKPAEIRALARKEKLLTLQKDGLRLVTEGKTSLEELQRAFKT